MARPWLVPVALFAVLVLGRLGHPLLWSDEAETAMYGRRVLAHGYPLVDDGESIVYELGLPLEVATRPGSGAFIGSPWLQYYAAAPAVRLSELAADLHTRTALVRLPFALAGLAGIALWLHLLFALLRRAGLPPGRFAALYGVLLCGSLNLALHLRELRYYPLVVLELAVLARLHLGRTAVGDVSPRVAAIAVPALLVLLFHTLLPAFAAAGIALAADAVWRLRRISPRARPGPWLREAAPLAAALLLVLPGVVWYDALRLGREMLGLRDASFATNAALALHYFATRELLAPALLATGLRRLVAASTPGGVGRGAPLARAADFLLLLVAATALAVARVPWVFSRYLVGASPALTLVLVLELALLGALLRARAGAPGAARPAPWPAQIARAAPLALVLAVSAPKAPQLIAHLRTLWEPYRGPLDYAIARLAALAPADRPLLVATNYGASVYQYYLRATVVVGLPGVVPPRLRDARPDVVIVRRFWAHHPRLERYLARGGYVEEALPVADHPWNNVPELWHLGGDSPRHLFRTPRPRHAGERLRLHLDRSLLGEVAGRAEGAARGAAGAGREQRP